MKKGTIIIFLLITGGIVLGGTAYATITQTTITNSGITTPTITTNSCTGCGGTEGSYSIYTQIINKSLSISNGGTGAAYDLFVSNNGSLIFDTGSSFFVKTDSLGNIVEKLNNADYAVARTDAQSANGYYQIGYASDNGTIYIFKNDVLLTTKVMGTGTNQNGCANGGNTPSIAISPNGKILAFACDDSTIADTRIYEWQGS